ncbi:MAG: ABC transporter permease [Anaerolineae bacterium]|nr:ABC transporter permease [Anaerolineae bacterium]
MTSIRLKIQQIIDNVKTLPSNDSFSVIVKVVLAVLLGLLIVYLVTLVVSENPQEAFKAFITGPISQPNRISDWITDAINLTMLGLAISIVFQANQFSLGAEGQLIFGAMAAGAVALFLPPFTGLFIVGLIASGVAGFLWGVLPGVLKAYLGSDEIVSTLMLNFIAVQIYDFLLQNFFMPPGAGAILSDVFPAQGLLPVLGGKVRTSAGLIVAVLAVIIVWAMLYRTPYGFNLRMSGFNEKFAQHIGLNVKQVIWLSMAVSGIFAGISGGILAMGVHTRLVQRISGGMAFEGIIVSMLAQNNPLLVPVAAVAYSYLRIGADVMERTSDVSREIVIVVQAIMILFLTVQALPRIRNLRLKYAFGRKKM